MKSAPVPATVSSWWSSLKAFIYQASGNGSFQSRRAERVRLRTCLCIHYWASVCDVSDLRLTHKLCWFPLRCTNRDESRLWTYEDWAQRLWVELWPVKVDEVWGLFQSKVWNVCGLTQTFVSFVVLLCDRRPSAAGFTLMMFVDPLPRSSCV